MNESEEIRLNTRCVSSLVHERDAGGLMHENVFAVIVCYEPELANLRRTCDSLIDSRAAVILVDNTTESRLERSGQFADCTLILNGDNLGIAEAQNIGIARAIERGAQIVVFFDQDSRITAGFLPTLVAPLSIGVAEVVAPVSRDALEDFEYAPSRVQWYGGEQHVYADGQHEPYPVDIIHSSGTAATVEAFARAGVMEATFFMDYVDVEWSLRLRYYGVPIRIVPTAVMQHSIGGRPLKLRCATVLVHSPIRCYYQIRNSLLLFRKESVPVLFTIRAVALLAVHKLLLLFGVPNRGAYLKAYVTATYDGVRGLTGKSLRHL